MHRLRYLVVIGALVVVLSVVAAGPAVAALGGNSDNAHACQQVRCLAAARDPLAGVAKHRAWNRTMPCRRASRDLSATLLPRTPSRESHAFAGPSAKRTTGLEPATFGLGTLEPSGHRGARG